MQRAKSSSRPAPPIATAFAVVMAATVVAVLALIALSADSRSAREFWGRTFLVAREAEHYDSLAEMTAAADAVVRGRIVAFERGRVFGTPEEGEAHYASAFVAVDEVLAGSLPEKHRQQLTLEILLPDPTAFEALHAEFPATETLFFLRHKGTELANLGWGPEVVAADADYYRLVVLRAVAWNSSGRAGTLVDTHADAHVPDFITQLNGASFTALVERVRSAGR